MQKLASYGLNKLIAKKAVSLQAMASKKHWPELMDLKLNTPIRYVKGCGPKRAKLFNKLGVHTVEDLLEYYPRDWILPTDVVKIGEMEPGKNVIITGKIKSVEYQDYSRVPVFKITVADDTGECRSIWFNGGYLRHQLRVGQTVMLAGKVEKI